MPLTTTELYQQLEEQFSNGELLRKPEAADSIMNFLVHQVPNCDVTVSSKAEGRLYTLTIEVPAMLNMECWRLILKEVEQSPYIKLVEMRSLDFTDEILKELASEFMRNDDFLFEDLWIDERHTNSKPQLVESYIEFLSCPDSKVGEFTLLSTRFNDDFVEKLTDNVIYSKNENLKSLRLLESTSNMSAFSGTPIASHILEHFFVALVSYDSCMVELSDISACFVPNQDSLQWRMNFRNTINPTWCKLMDQIDNCTNLKDSNGELQSKVTILEEQNGNLKSKVASHEGQISSLESKVVTLEEHNSKLQSLLTQLSEQVQKLTNQARPGQSIHGINEISCDSDATPAPEAVDQSNFESDRLGSKRPRFF